MATNETKNNDVAGVAAVKEKKQRKPQVRKPVELAVVVRVVDSNGSPITDATVEVLMATKDISTAFRAFKDNPGSDMTTFKLGEQKVETEKTAA